MPGNYFELFPEQEQRSRREHAALLEAMEAGDGRAARALAEDHVLSAGEALGRVAGGEEGGSAGKTCVSLTHEPGAGVTLP